MGGVCTFVATPFFPIAPDKLNKAQIKYVKNVQYYLNPGPRLLQRPSETHPTALRGQSYLLLLSGCFSTSRLIQTRAS